MFFNWLHSLPFLTLILTLPPFPFRSFLPIHGVLSSCTNLLLCYETVFIAYLYLVCVYHPVYFVYSINLFFFHLSVSSFVLQCGGSHTLDCINSIYLSLYFTFCQWLTTLFIYVVLFVPYNIKVIDLTNYIPVVTIYEKLVELPHMHKCEKQ